MLYLEYGVLMACGIVVALWAVNFPYPSPLLRPFLRPQKRWPEGLVRKWLKTGRLNKAYSRYFYRDPERVLPAETGIIAPADGLVTSFEVKDGIRYLVIALSFWDMHVQRAPLTGEVVGVSDMGDDYMDGEGRDFAFLREKACPVQKRVVLRTELGEIAVRLITSLAARRIEVWSKPGERLERGQRLGRILLGSTVVLEIPQDWPVLVEKGQRVWAGESLVVGLPEEAR
jgi:phosphatidylserine decarboxylase